MREAHAQRRQHNPQPPIHAPVSPLSDPLIHALSHQTVPEQSPFLAHATAGSVNGSEEPDGPHDNGSVTVLFNVIGGLQVLDDTDSRRYVRPERAHGIVKLGDSMVQWTGGVLRSNMHRVVPPPGAQSECPPFSMAYVLKPLYACRMERLGGEGIPLGERADEEVGTYEEFHAKKSKGIREGKNLINSRGGKKTEKGVDVRMNEIVV